MNITVFSITLKTQSNRSYCKCNAMPQTPSQNACGTQINGFKGMLLIFPCLIFLSELCPSLDVRPP